MNTTPDARIKQPLKVAVIGGGAAGYFTAVNTAEKNPRAQITIFEAGSEPLRKVRISGGGRCNVTHACFEPARLVEFYPRGQKELRSLFARFQPKDTVRWFESRGLKLKTEPDNRIFPQSDCSGDVIDILTTQAEALGIRLKRQAKIDSIRKEGEQFQLCLQGKTETFDVCVLATGYSPTGWKLAETLGHTIIPPVPSLFPFTVKSPIIEGLQGISVPHAAGKLFLPRSEKPCKVQAEGPLLITHTGLSGPLIYRLSAWGARDLAEQGYQANLQIDLVPEFHEQALRKHLAQLFYETDAKKQVANTSLTPLPRRLWHSLLENTGIPLGTRCETLSKKSFNMLIEHLKRLTLPVTGKSPSKEEFVSCGGVSLKEVNFQTLESKRVPGLYFAGEILDIDGLTGGFNFQACWSGGWVVSEALAAQ
ncbi:MAG TPA: NAD(P)/FAD-dependent oxidoreductase [Oculatellaceae cyanobacterium]|jgi:predicted Rossmann fold flavoprotein